MDLGHGTEMGQPVTDAEFGRMLASFSGSAFRFEARASYVLGYERADFEAFRAGTLASLKK